MQQVLLKRSRDGRLSRRRKTCEPDGEAGLLAECVALSARKGRVPGDVAVDVQYTARSDPGLKMVGWRGLEGYSRCHYEL